MWSVFNSGNPQNDGLFGTSVCNSDYNVIIGAEGEIGYRTGAAYILTDFANYCETSIEKSTEELLSMNYGVITGETVSLGGVGCNYTIPPDATIAYRANEITLGNGFTAEQGCDFTAYAFNECNFYDFTTPINNYVCVVQDEVIEKEIDKVKHNKTTKNNFYVYPNPVAEKLNITYSLSPINHIIILDLLGRVLFEKKNLNTSYEIIDFSGFASGMYYIHVKAENDEYSDKIIH
ncbi:MAG: T9SS type A sorting domain-containing protein [Bacteroidales bacterium]|nr:T9SS type A sorting domain-containing protein [Bacteroidales bacterium]